MPAFVSAVCAPVLAVSAAACAVSAFVSAVCAAVLAETAASLALSEAVCAVCAAVADVEADVAEFADAVALAAAFVIVDFMPSISLCNCSACVGVGSMGATSDAGAIAGKTFIVVEADMIMRSAVVPSVAKSMPRIVIVISPAYAKGSAGIGTMYASPTSKSVVKSL